MTPLESWGLVLLVSVGALVAARVTGIVIDALRRRLTATRGPR